MKLVPFNAAATLDTPAAIDEYLKAALETGDAEYIALAKTTAAEAQLRLKKVKD